MRTVMRDFCICICAAVLLGAGVAQAALVWDPGQTLGGGGGSGTWDLSPANTNWYQASSNTDIAWPNSSSPRDDIVFGGTAGTVAVLPGVGIETTLYAGDIRFDTAGYVIQPQTTAAKPMIYIDFTGFSGTGLASSGFATAATTNNILVNFRLPSAGRTSYPGDFTTGTGGRLSIFEGGGTLELNRASAYTSVYGFYARGGTFLLNTNYIRIPTHLYAYGTNLVTPTGPGTIGGIGSTVGWSNLGGSLVIGDNKARADGILAPGDPLVNDGIGSLTVNHFVKFYNSSDANTLATYQVELASGTSYDKLIMQGTNVGTVAPLDLTFSYNGTDTIYGPALNLNFRGSFDASVGNFLAVVDNRVAPSVAGKAYTIKGTFANAADNARGAFTNDSGVGFGFVYKYNVDKDTLGAGNDFGLLMDERVVTAVDGPYTVDSSAVPFSGTVTGGTVASWAWDYNMDGIADDSVASPSHDNSYFTSTFGWELGETYTIKLKTVDSLSVESWGTASLTLVPEPGTMALLLSGAVLGLLRRRRR